jgi:hypothetical protein
MLLMEFAELAIMGAFPLYRKLYLPTTSRGIP